MVKQKYLSNFDYFSLWSDTLFGLLECDYSLSWTFEFWFDNYEHLKFIILFSMFKMKKLNKNCPFFFKI